MRHGRIVASGWRGRAATQTGVGKEREPDNGSIGKKGTSRRWRQKGPNLKQKGGRNRYNRETSRPLA